MIAEYFEEYYLYSFKAEVEVKAGSGQPASRNQKELQFLLTRQKEFKMAALQAKKDGNIENAKDYLRKAKVLDLR